jgi:CheY-like chemotaxis protein
MAELNREPLHILLVGDNDAHSELVIRSMRDQQVGNTIHHVVDGEQALDYLFTRGAFADPGIHHRPHVVLLDLRLPRVDGLEVLRTIKTTLSLLRIPVVILTSLDPEIDRAKSYDYHANSYVVKPLDFKTFTKLMKDPGFYWFAWNAKPLAG